MGDDDGCGGDSPPGREALGARQVEGKLSHEDRQIMSAMVNARKRQGQK